MSRYFARYDVLGLLRHIQPRLEILIGQPLQIVDVVKERVLDIGHARFHVARHRDVDQEHRLVLARFNSPPHHLAGDHEPLRRRDVITISISPSRCGKVLYGMVSP